MLWDLSVHNTSLRLDQTWSRTGQDWKYVCVLPCLENRIKSYHWGGSFSFFSLQRFNWKLSPNTTSFDTSSTTNSSEQHVHNLLILVLLHFLFRHLHKILPLIRCHHQCVLHLDSELSLDLQAHCSASLTLWVSADFTSRFSLKLGVSFSR